LLAALSVVENYVILLAESPPPPHPAIARAAARAAPQETWRHLRTF
jgi:hypothetical protein